MNTIMCIRFLAPPVVYHIPTRQNPNFTELTHIKVQDKKEESRQLCWDMIYNTKRYHTVLWIQSMSPFWTEVGGLHNEVDFKLSPELPPKWRGKKQVCHSIKEQNVYHSSEARLCSIFAFKDVLRDLFFWSWVNDKRSE